MCELFGFSSSKKLASAPFLGEFALRGGETGDNPDGWGAAYRWQEGFVVEKDTGPGAASDRFSGLASELYTDLLIAHVRKANPPTALTLENTHPFVRICCGRQWAFAHNGKVEEILRPESRCRPSECRFSGATDSEQTFCYLLQEIARVMPEENDSIDEGWFSAVAAASGLVAKYGQFNFLLSDGTYLLAHAHDRLHGYTGREGKTIFAALASEPLSQADAWKVLGPHKLHVFRKGCDVAVLDTSPGEHLKDHNDADSERLRIQSKKAEVCYEHPICSE